MNKLHPSHHIAIALVAAAALLSSKSNNRYSIREAVHDAAESLRSADGQGLKTPDSWEK